MYYQLLESSTVFPPYNNHLYNGNFDFWLNVIGKGSFYTKIYYIKRNSHYLTLTVIPGDEMHFYTHFLFIKMTEKIIQ